MPHLAHSLFDADAADGGGHEAVGRVGGEQRVRKGLLIALAHEIRQQLVVQRRLHIEEAGQQQAPPQPVLTPAADAFFTVTKERLALQVVASFGPHAEGACQQHAASHHAEQATDAGSISATSKRLVRAFSRPPSYKPLLSGQRTLAQSRSLTFLGRGRGNTCGGAAPSGRSRSCRAAAPKARCSARPQCLAPQSPPSSRATAARLCSGRRGCRTAASGSALRCCRSPGIGSAQRRLCHGRVEDGHQEVQLKPVRQLLESSHGAVATVSTAAYKHLRPRTCKSTRQRCRYRSACRCESAIRQPPTSSKPLSSTVAAFMVKPGMRPTARGSARAVTPSRASAARSPGVGSSASGKNISTGSVHPSAETGHEIRTWPRSWPHSIMRPVAYSGAIRHTHLHDCKMLLGWSLMQLSQVAPSCVSMPNLVACAQVATRHHRLQQSRERTCEPQHVEADPGGHHVGQPAGQDDDTAAAGATLRVCRRSVQESPPLLPGPVHVFPAAQRHRGRGQQEQAACTLLQAAVQLRSPPAVVRP